MASDRIRGGTMGAEGILHDMGVIGITSSDAQGMGRAGETVRRTFQLAAAMKVHLGMAAGDVATRHDNERVQRYIAKLTINPAIAHGLSHEIGSIEVGKLADIVLWRPDHFGAKPQMVLKAGFPLGVTGDPNATTDSLREPLVLGPLFGGLGATPADLSVAFVSQAAAAADNDHLTTRRRRVGVRNTRNIGPADLVHNARLGTVEVDNATGMVSFDGNASTPTPSSPSRSAASTSSEESWSPLALPASRCLPNGHHTSGPGWSSHRSITTSPHPTVRRRSSTFVTADRGHERRRPIRAGLADLQSRRWRHRTRAPRPRCR
ncbi:MAG: amidohydrolase family protein [Acidimicrobiales bacterium]